MLRVIKDSVHSAWALQKVLGASALGTSKLWLLHKSGKLDTKKKDGVIQPWAKGFIEGIGGKITLEGAPLCNKPCLLVGNHMSYLDIPLLWNLESVSFVSKKEVGDWPLVGTSARAIDTIFVDRNSQRSRGETLSSIHRAIDEDKKQVVIFPEGTSSIAGKRWNLGSFRTAERFNLTVQPFRIFYSPSRLAAFVDDDILLPCLWKLTQNRGFRASIKLFPPRQITNAQKDCQEVQDLVQSSVAECLELEKRGCYAVDPETTKTLEHGTETTE